MASACFDALDALPPKVDAQPDAIKLKTSSKMLVLLTVMFIVRLPSYLLFSLLLLFHELAHLGKSVS